MKKILNVIKILLPLSVGIWIIWYVYKDLTDHDKVIIINAFNTAQYGWIILSMFLGLLAHISRAIRWNILLKPLGYTPKLYNTFFCVMIGYLATMAFHRVGEIIRCGYLKRYENVPVNKGFGTVIVERAFDFVCLLLISITVLIVEFEVLKSFLMEEIVAPVKEGFLSTYEEQLTFYIIVIVGALISTGLIIFVVRKKGEHSLVAKVKGLVLGLWDGMKSIKNIDNVGSFIFHTVFIWTMYFLMAYVCFFSLPETSSLGVTVALAVFVFGSIGIIAVQGGIGAYPAIVMKTLMEFGLPKALGFAFGWLVWTSQAITIISLGLASLILIQWMNRDKAV